jgi:DNA-binding LacI/PurR family transcriptional regulator
VVVIDRKVFAKTDMVRCDSEGGAYQLVKLLLDLGHRHIAMINGPADVSTSADRFAGYKRAMEEAGFLENIICYYGSFNQERGYELTKKAMSQIPRPTALFAANNVIGIGTLWALQDLEIKVPDDIAVVGFDDLPANLVVKPTLTVAAQPAYEMGRKATELILNRLNTPASDNDCLNIVLPVEFIVRSSSGKAIQQ